MEDFFTNPPILLLWGIVFASGLFAGYVTFASDFVTPPKDLWKSVYCHLYAIFCGLMALLTFAIVRKLDIEVASFSFSDNSLLSAAILGVSWYAMLASTLMKLNDTEAEEPNPILSLFIKTKGYLYHHYARAQLTKLRPIVWGIIKDIDGSDFYHFCTTCISVARGINPDKGNALGETYAAYQKNNVTVSEYSCSIATNIARIIGIDLVQQVAVEMTEFAGNKDSGQGSSTSSIIEADLDALGRKLIEFEAVRPPRGD